MRMTTLRKRIVTGSAVVLIGITFVVAWQQWHNIRNQREIETYLAQNRPTATGGVQLIEARGLLPAPATTKNILEAAAIVVNATVNEVSQSFKDEHGVIYHTVTLRVASIYKTDGRLNPPQDIVVQVLGGQLDDQLYWALDAPKYEQGEHVIAFLSMSGETYFTTYETYGVVHFRDGSTVRGISEEDGLFEMSLNRYEEKLSTLLRKKDGAVQEDISAE